MTAIRKEDTFDIQAYMTRGVERVVADAMKATLLNPKESAFMVKFAAASRAASKKRKDAEKKGEPIPPFLIASITSSCNLHCAGCYSRCTNATVDAEPVQQLSAAEWSRIFDEAGNIGVSFILLAGGEPMLRYDVIEQAGERQDILFPVFTNGTCMHEEYFYLFDRRRNLIPIFSIEGNRGVTDARRGEGIYDRLMSSMDEMKRRGLIFGASVTVTTENVREVSSDEFIRTLAERGCKVVIYVEYVPVDEYAGEEDRPELEDDAFRGREPGADESTTGTSLAPGETERAYLRQEINRLREEYPEMMFISFPGDEKSSGGCIAAGRGFFHINSHGGAEPCPFSPYSDINVRDTSLREALRSKLFRVLTAGDILKDDHEGGCVLYEKRELVEAILAE